MERETGIVQWFNDAKGFGFVETERGDQIICEKWHMTHEPKTMKERQRISFRRDTWEGREVAREITVLEHDAVPPPVLNMNQGTVYCETPLIIVFENAVSDEICDEIIAKHIADGMNPDSGKQSRQESYAQVTEDVEQRGISLGMDAHHYNIIANAIVENCGFPHSLIEAIDIYNYDVGRYLDLHHDYPYFPDKINYYSHGENDRVGTGILYLNDDYEGGTTYFPKLGVDINPKKGSLLYFKQCYDEPTNWSTIHESTKIIKGRKWIASCFFSERERIGFTDRENFMPEESPTFNEPFYVKKFMEIQRGNVQLYRKLKNIETNSTLKAQVEEILGKDFFSNLDELIK
jgi:prolyl 4-hydroxylase